MKNQKKTSFVLNNLLVLLAAVMLMCASALVINADSSATTMVSISPASQTVNPSDIFNVNVYCVPGQPIRAYQFSLSFDPSLIQCNSVTEGNIFSGHSSFFGYVGIDNVAGDVNLVYNAIMGAGNVTGSGTFAVISFTAQSGSGTSVLNLNTVKVENETVPVPISVNDGSVTVTGTNNPPYTPSNPSPSDGKTNVDRNKVLSWSGGDPDSGDTVTYDVFFGTSNPPSKISSNQSGTNYDPGTMSYNTKYYWKIIAWDKNSTSTEGPIWSFTTEKKSTPYNPPYNPPPTNQDPVADASAGEPYQGFVGEEITFDGSLSYDPDTEGYIVSWYWSYGDGTNGTGETTIHMYYYAGTYTATLTVADNEDAENTCETTVLISQPNRPPSKPSIEGPTSGKQNIDYIYTVVSTDPDNDTIKYSFIWGDQTSYVAESEFLPSGSVFTANQIWTVAGKYTITVTATDNKTISETSELTVLIDAVNVENIGYFIDINGDGIYDSFHNDTSNQNSDVDYDDGKYLVDDNGDGEWDFTYSMEEGLKSYEKEETLTPGFGLILVVCALILVLFWKRKRNE